MIDLRTAKPSDHAYIAHTWGSEAVRYRGPRVSKRIARSNSSKNANRLLKDDDARIAVICDVENPDSILGFAVAKHGCIHWVSVRKAFRHHGLGTLLLQAVAPKPTAYSASTPHVMKWERIQILQFSPSRLPCPPKSSQPTGSRSSATSSDSAPSSPTQKLDVPAVA